MSGYILLHSNYKTFICLADPSPSNAANLSADVVVIPDPAVTVEVTDEEQLDIPYFPPTMSTRDRSVTFKYLLTDLKN